MTILSVGIVGAGEITRRAHLPVLLNTPGVQVAWLYDNSAARASSLGQAFGVRSLHSMPAEQLPPCAIALLAIPVDVRAVYLRHFAAQGTAVFCEKPFSMSAVEHASALGDFAAYALACGFMRRFYRSTMLLRQIVTEGRFGPLRSIEISEGNRSKGSGIDDSFLDDPQLGASRGVLADLGSHGIDMALYVSGASAFRVNRCSKILDGAVDRKVVAAIELEGEDSTGRTSIDFRFAVSWLDRQSNRIRLDFDRLSVWSELAIDSRVYAGDPQRPRLALSLVAPTTGASTFNQAFYLEWREFLRGYRERRESAISARSALLTTSLVESLLVDRGDSCA